MWALFSKLMETSIVNLCFWWYLCFWWTLSFSNLCDGLLRDNGDNEVKDLSYSTLLGNEGKGLYLFVY